MTAWLRIRFLTSALTAAHLAAALLFWDDKQLAGAIVFGMLAIAGIVATIDLVLLLNSKDQAVVIDVQEVEDAPESVEAYILVFVSMFVSTRIEDLTGLAAFLIFYGSAVILFYARSTVVANPVMFVMGWRFSYVTLTEGPAKRRHLTICRPGHPIGVGKQRLHRIGDGGIYLFHG